MYAWLVVNEYLRSPKFEEIYEYLIKAAETRGCKLEKITNFEVMTNLDELIKKKPEFVIYWDKDLKAALLLEKQGLRLFNSARAVEICDDKSLTYIELSDSDVRMPATIVCPLTFGLEENLNYFVDCAIKKFGLPFIIKENCGSFGAQVYKVDDRIAAIDTIEKIGNTDFIIQEYVETSKGRDVRINIVGGEAVASMMRTNESDFRANITNGGTMNHYEPTVEQIEMAKRVCEILELDFAGVDILFGDGDEPIFCEVNSNAHFKNIMDCTGVNVAEKIIDYIIKCVTADKLK